MPVRLLAALSLGAILLTACAGGTASETTAGSADAPLTGAVEVAVDDNRFEPGTVTVAAGTTVTWTWEGDRDHDVRGPGFASPTQGEGTFEHVFDEPGSYDYVCSIHGGMKGTVEVVTG